MRRGQKARLEKAAGIEQIINPLARVQNALGAALGELIFATHFERLGAPVVEFLQECFKCHFRFLSLAPLAGKAQGSVYMRFAASSLVVQNYQPFVRHVLDSPRRTLAAIAAEADTAVGNLIGTKRRRGVDNDAAAADFPDCTHDRPG